jgi:plasmid stabilization system protein ParE
MVRLHGFLAPKSPEAARRAIKAIRQGLKALGKHSKLAVRRKNSLPNSANGSLTSEVLHMWPFITLMGRTLSFSLCGMDARRATESPPLLN